jgi:hypothetical protein
MARYTIKVPQLAGNATAEFCHIIYGIRVSLDQRFLSIYILLMEQTVVGTIAINGPSIAFHIKKYE